MQFLKATKNAIKRMMLMTPGIKKNLLIDTTFASKIAMTIGPYIDSMRAKLRMLSMTLRSFENLELRLPVVVVSK